MSLSTTKSIIGRTARVVLFNNNNNRSSLCKKNSSSIISSATSWNTTTTTVGSATTTNNSFRFYKYNYSQVSSEEIRRLSEEAYSKGSTPWITGLLGVLAGFGLGYYLSQQIIGQEGGEPKLKEAGIEKVAKGSKNIVELFEQFADVDIVVDQKYGRSEKMMSLEAFINSLLTSRPDAPVWVALPRRDGKLLVDKKRANDEQLKLIFEYADTDKNGYISFDEYALFMTFLSCSERQLQIAFQCFDLDGSGSIEASEFKELIKASRLRKITTKKDILDDIDWNNNGLMIRLFGSDLSQKLSFDEFNKFIHKCKSALLKQEFLQYDVEGNGLISVEAFSELMTKSVHYNSTTISEFKRQLNLLKTRGFFAPTGRIDYDTFKAFNDMAAHSEDIGIAIQLITSSRGGMKKQDFKLALERVAKIKVTDRVVDLVYAIYDKDKDGVLEYDEFMSTMRARKEKM